MLKITESSRAEVEKILNGLNWISEFWTDKMKLMAKEGKVPRDEFIVMRDNGVKFQEKFIIPMAEIYEQKLTEFKVEATTKPEPAPKKPDMIQEPEGVTESEIVGDGTFESIPRRGRPAGSKNKDKSGTIERLEVPPSLAPEEVPTPEAISPKTAYGATHPRTPSATPVTDSSPGHTYGGRRPHSKARKSHMTNSLTLAQRDQITLKWIENKGVMNDLKCSELAKVMGFGGPNQVQGWVSYLTKVCNNNPSYEGRAKGWKYMIDNEKISNLPVPAFFVDKVEVAFTVRPKAVI